MNGSWLASRCHSYSAAAARNSARSCPYSLAITAKDMSMPADTPDEVTNFPSSTHRAFSTHCTLSFGTVISEKNCLFEVARRPSSKPALARMPEPEHTDMVTVRSMIVGGEIPTWQDSRLQRVYRS